MKFYKILNEAECHHGFSYRTGLNIDVREFRPSGDCEPGGLYFSREDILHFVSYGPWIREVTLPKEALLYQNPGHPVKWKADRIILGERRRIDKAIVAELIAEGANICSEFLSWVANRNDTEMLRPYLGYLGMATENVLWDAVHSNANNCVKMLIESGLKPWTGLLDTAIYNGNLELVELMINLADRNTLINAAQRGKFQITKLLLDHGIRSKEAIFFAARAGYMDIVDLLAPFGVKYAIDYAKRNSASVTTIERLNYALLQNPE